MLGPRSAAQRHPTLSRMWTSLRYMAMGMIMACPRRGTAKRWASPTPRVYAGIAPVMGDAAGGLVYDVYGAHLVYVITAGASLLGRAIAHLKPSSTELPSW